MKKLLTITYILSVIFIGTINFGDNKEYKVAKEPYKISVSYMDPGGTN
ncbi:hypothetical protein [Bacillus mycoides]|nr:hypothetical protein [Bacillus mycoides]